MDDDFLGTIEKDYDKIKSEFQKTDNLQAALKITKQIKEHGKLFKSVFFFLVSIFKGKSRNDKKTPLVFHSIYLTRLAYLCGEKDLGSLLTVALHDVLEDTEISEEILLRQEFMKGHEKIIDNLRILKENKDLSRDPDGKNLPLRYAEHIKRLIGSPKEVINTEIIDRFSDLMDLEYIMELPEKELELRLKAKMIKTKSFVYNLIRGRRDFNKKELQLFESKIKQLEKEYNIHAEMQLVNPQSS